MTGEHVRDDLSLYALGLLEGEEVAAVERHLASCGECRAELETYDTVVGALAGTAAGPASPSLRDAIVARHRRRSWLPMALPRPLIAVGFAALALALIGLATVEDVVRLEAQAGAASANAAVVVGRNGAAFMILGLPPVANDRAYEAWVIRDGAAIPAGLAPAGQGFAVIALGVAVLPGDVTAVTVEPAAGARTPSSDPILLGARGRS